MCQERFKLIEEAEFQNWKGLDDTCSVDEFTKVFELVSSHKGKGYLGRKNSPNYFHTFRIPGHKKPSRLWLASDEKIKMIEIENPANVDLEKLSDELGSPAEKADYYFGQILIKDGEWVYPEKGISLKLNADYDRIVKILLFQPVSFEMYQDQLSYSSPQREFKRD